MLKDLIKQQQKNESNKRRGNVFCIYLPTEIADKLRTISEKYNLVISNIVTDSLKEYFKDK